MEDLFIWNVAPVVSVATLAGLGGLTATAGVCDILDIIQFFIQCQIKLYFTQLIKGKLRDLQNILKYFHGATTSASDLFKMSDVFFVIFVLHSYLLLSWCSLPHNHHHYFH